MGKIHGVRVVMCALISSLVLQLAGCGTVFYPERRGQKSGELDVKIVVADAIGLLFFIIPGVAAFVIDFATGAIYLPGGRRNIVNVDQAHPFRASMHLAPEQLYNQQELAKSVGRQLNLPDTIDWSKLQVARITPEQMEQRLAEAQAVNYAR